MQKGFLLWSVILFSATGCATPPLTPVLPTPEFVTATLPSTSTPAESATPLPPTSAPTIEPVPATTTSEVNLRAEPSTASASLGTIPPFTAIQVEGRESFGYWARILYDGKMGWVRAEYVQASAEIPTLGAETGSGSGVRGAVLRGVNVRSRPGKDFDSLGLLNQYDIVEILEKDSSGEWLRIRFPPAADGLGWVAAEYLEAEGLDALPVTDALEQSVEVEPPIAPTPVSIIAEGDSADAPLGLFSLAADSARSILFRGEVSTASDSEDWVGFSSAFPELIIQLTCESGSAQAEFPNAPAVSVGCGEVQTIAVEPGRIYSIRITPLSDLAGYKIKISASP